jgi:putative ABC transport system substrate-binding protein
MRWVRLAFAIVLFTAAVDGVAVANTQSDRTVPRIAVLGNEDNPPWEAFRRGLRDHGYVEGKTVAVDWRWSDGQVDRLPALATELVGLKPDVIIASGTQAIRAARQATSTIPIVMTVSAYPDKLGFVATLARPGGNITGLSSLAPDLYAKKLELLKEIAPSVARVTLLWNPASPVETLGYRELQSAGRAVGLEIRSAEVRSPDGFAAAFATIGRGPANALMVHGNPINFKGRHVNAEFALKQGLPSVYEERLFVEAGGLISYAPRFTDLFRRAASYVDRILKGAKPGDLRSSSRRHLPS